MSDEPQTTALSAPSAPRSTQFAIGRLMPQSMKELHWLATQVAQSGFWLKSLPEGKTSFMNTAETVMVMTLGMEMGLTPLAAMENIYLIEDKHGRKTRIPRADLLAARILADPRTEKFSIDDSAAGVVVITAKRHDRRELIEVVLTLNDISQRDRQKWARAYLDEREMLVNRTIRKATRRHFKDMVLGLGVPDVDEGEREVIDVDAVEVAARIPASNGYGTCPQCGVGKLKLIPNPRGGGFLACNADCGYTSSPPAEVRDAMRGHREGGAVYQQNGAESDDTRHDGPTYGEPDPPGPALGVHQDAPAPPVATQGAADSPTAAPTSQPLPPPPLVVDSTAEEVMPPDRPTAGPDTSPPSVASASADGGVSAVEREPQEQERAASHVAAQREQDAMAGRIVTLRARIGAKMRELKSQREREAAMRAAGWPTEGPLSEHWPTWIQSLPLDELTEVTAFVCMDPEPPLLTED